MLSARIFTFVLILFLSCKPAEKAANELNGRWNLIDLNGQVITAFDEGKQINIHFSDSVLTGYNGCNQMNGSVEVSKTRIEFGPIATTRKLCPDFEDEQRVMDIFNGEKTYSISRDTLQIRGSGGNSVARFIRVDSDSTESD